MSKDFSANKGEWSELYVFLELLKDGKLYLADKNFNKMQDRFFEIVRIIRENIDYFTGNEIKIFCNNEYCMSISLDKVEYFSKKLFEYISKDQDDKMSFKVQSILDFLEEIKVNKIKAPSKNKVDILMEVKDRTTPITYSGYNAISGFSINQILEVLQHLLMQAKILDLNMKFLEFQILV